MNQLELFRAEGLPVLQNRMFNTRLEAINSTVGDVVLVQDLNTGLVFNNAFDPSKLEYDQSYQNEQAVSRVFKAHLDEVTQIIKRHFTNASLIEVGCGKGYFLDHLQKLGYNITGVDPAYDGNNPNIIKTPFEYKQGLSVDGIVLRHVLEHMVDPLAFLEQIADANARKGLIYIEVPCFDWIIKHKAWFDIFYEHVNYFRLSDFDRMFGTVLESGYVFGEQYLYVVADLATLRKPQFSNDCTINFPTDFLSSIERVAAIANTNAQNAIWGGASKGVIFTLYMHRAGVDINAVIDINPAKQGKYLASSGLRVLSPDNAMALLRPNDNIFVMNSNYLDEIMNQSSHQFKYIQVDYE